MERSAKEALLRTAYERFADHDIDALLALMTDDVEWPNVAERTVLRSHQAIRAYWEAQFAVADPRVTPTAFTEAGDDLVATITQHIFDLTGSPMTEPNTVYHRYSFRQDKVSRMVVFDDGVAAIA